MQRRAPFSFGRECKNTTRLHVVSSTLGTRRCCDLQETWLTALLSVLFQAASRGQEAQCRTEISAEIICSRRTAARSTVGRTTSATCRVPYRRIAPRSGLLLNAYGVFRRTHDDVGFFIATPGTVGSWHQGFAKDRAMEPLHRTVRASCKQFLPFAPRTGRLRDLRD